MKYEGNSGDIPVKPNTVLESLQQGLKRAFADDESIILIGEDVLDPYGGAFKVTKGLSTLYPDRVITTPISEAAIVGAAGGMALRGLRPIVEIMFGDFVTLIADQVINHITKFPFMYRQGVSVPLVIRTPMGGRRGYGATHSQSLEKLFLGVPGLRVLAPHTLGDPGDLLYQAIRFTKFPIFFVEHKLLYPLPLFNSRTQSEFEVEVMDEPDILSEVEGFSAAALRVRICNAPKPQVTLAAYGYMAELARQAMLTLAYEEEIFCDLVIFTRLAPLHIEALKDSLMLTGKLVVIEEGTIAWGWGSEVIAQASERLGPALKSARRVAAQDMIIPASKFLEDRILPSQKDIIEEVRAIG